MRGKLSIVVFFLFFWAATAAATTTSVDFFANTAQSSETNPQASYTGKLTYDPLHSTLTVTFLTTTGLIAHNGGFLTALVFNNPHNDITGVTAFTGPNNFKVIGGTTGNNQPSPFQDSINGQPFGQFDIGASISKSFQSAKKPSNGVAVGTDNFSFVFTFAGSKLDLLTAADFVKEVNRDGQFFEARFAGFKNGKSDKETGVVPLPSTLSLLSAGLVGVAGWRRFRKS